MIWVGYTVGIYVWTEYMKYFDKYKVYLLAIACAYTLTALTTGIAATFRPTDLINQHQYISIQSTNTSVSNSSVPLVCIGVWVLQKIHININ